MTAVLLGLLLGLPTFLYAPLAAHTGSVLRGVVLVAGLSATGWLAATLAGWVMGARELPEDPPGNDRQRRKLEDQGTRFLPIRPFASALAFTLWGAILGLWIAVAHHGAEPLRRMVATASTRELMAAAKLLAGFLAVLMVVAWIPVRFGSRWVLAQRIRVNRLAASAAVARRMAAEAESNE